MESAPTILPREVTHLSLTGHHHNSTVALLVHLVVNQAPTRNQLKATTPNLLNLVVLSQAMVPLNPKAMHHHPHLKAMLHPRKSQSSLLDGSSNGIRTASVGTL